MYTERFDEGDRQQIWSELLVLGDKVRADYVYEDALELARQTMVAVRNNIERIIDAVSGLGYRFGEHSNGEPNPHYSAPLVAPPSNIDDQIAEFEEPAGVLPISIAALRKTVGSVDFTGYHPDWPAYADQLIVYPVEAAFESHEEWEEQCDDDGIDVAGPLLIRLAVDGLLTLESHNTTLVNYLWIIMLLSDYLRNAVDQLGLIKEPWDSPIYSLPSAQSLRLALIAF
ncbi:MAG: hypothetical protein H8E66_08210 [Planctomycetes bacterium]|nr:hypothetical protein [Planctomycetota bacterium]